MQPGWPRRLAPACHSALSAEFNHNSHGLSPKANAPWSEQALHREGGGQRAWQTPGLGSPRHGLSRDRLWHIGALRDGTGDTEGWIEAPGAGVSSPLSLGQEAIPPLHFCVTSKSPWSVTTVASQAGSFGGMCVCVGECLHPSLTPQKLHAHPYNLNTHSIQYTH